MKWAECPDDEAEAIAMEKAMDYEKEQGWTPYNVSANNEGHDIRSLSPEKLRACLEVKGRSGADGSVMLSENEMNRLSQLGDHAWLYIVINCKSSPELFRIQNPAKLRFEKKSKGVQYFLPFRSCLHLTLQFCYGPFHATLRCQNPHLATAKLRFWRLD